MSQKHRGPRINEHPDGSVVYLNKQGELCNWKGAVPEKKIDAVVLVANNKLVVLDSDNFCYGLNLKDVDHLSDVKMIAGCNGNATLTGTDSIVSVTPDCSFVYLYMLENGNLIRRSYTNMRKYQRKANEEVIFKGAPLKVIRLASSTKATYLILDDGKVVSFHNSAFHPITFPSPVKMIATKEKESFIVLFTDGKVMYYAEEGVEGRPIEFSGPVEEISWGQGVSALLENGTVERKFAPVRGYKMVDEKYLECEKSYLVGQDTVIIEDDPKDRYESRHTFVRYPMQLAERYKSSTSRILEVEARGPVEITGYNPNVYVSTQLHVMREISPEEFCTICTGRFMDNNGVEWVYDSQKVHCTDGPAMRYTKGVYGIRWDMRDADGVLHGWRVTERWMENNEMHRGDGPAVKYDDGAEEWWWRGKRHCTTGPATTYANGTKVYYLHGTKYTLKSFLDCYKFYCDSERQLFCFICDEGELELYPTSPLNQVAIYKVVVKNQRTGIFSQFIQALQKEESIASICIVAVSSPEMKNCLDKMGNFIDHGGDFVWTRI